MFSKIVGIKIFYCVFCLIELLYGIIFKYVYSIFLKIIIYTEVFIINKLSRNFYLTDTIEVAKKLLGKNIVRIIDNKRLVMKITETEAYIADIDKACHAYGGKKTKRTEVMFQEGGKAYIYLIYGMYYCFNVVTEKKDKACAVLIRGAKPVENINQLSLFRYGKNYGELTKYQIKNFANGPGKLCKALNIDKNLNGVDLLDNRLFIEGNENQVTENINVAKRINIDYAQEAKDFLWRFFIDENISI